MRNLTTQELTMISGGEENSVPEENNVYSENPENPLYSMACAYAGAGMAMTGALLMAGSNLKDSLSTSFLLAPMTIAIGGTAGVLLYKYARS